MKTTNFTGIDVGVAGLQVGICNIAGLALLTPARHGDRRGFFSECFKAEWFAALGVPVTFLQDNHSMSRPKGVLRGLHYQAPPFAQGKLIRVLRGSIYDVALDIRRSSPTYGRHASVVLDAAKGDQFWVPIGFAHGFATLNDDTEVLYKVTGGYAPKAEGGVAWNDPDLGIAWPVDAGSVTLAERDARWPRLADLTSPFV